VPLRPAALCGLAGMLVWAVSLAMVPVDARLSDGAARVADMLRTADGRLVWAIPGAALGAVLMLVLLAALAATVPASAPGGVLLRTGLAAGVLTNAVVLAAVVLGSTAAFLAGAGGDAQVVAALWTGLYVGFGASALPTVVLSIAVGLGAGRAGLAPRWVTVLSACSAAGHLVVIGATGHTGPFALDGTVGLVIPLTTVIWLIAQSAVLLRRSSRRCQADDHAAASPT
jgi:hypothetical protein